MNKALLLALVVLTVLSVVACTRPPSRPIPVTSQTNLEALVAGNDSFAFDLYQSLRKSDSNLFYSPYSISLALAMAYAGARGETEEQMADILHFNLPQNSLHPAFNSLDNELGRRGESTPAAGGKRFQLHVANAIWGQEGYNFLSSFLDLLTENYGAGLKTLDFAKAPEDSRITINNWVSKQTESRIKDLVPPGVIDALTKLVLTNAIYFNASWENPFPKGATHDGSFYLLNGTKTTVPMMRQTGFFNYADGDGYQAIELRYYGGGLSMVIILPKAGKFEAFESSLDIQRMKEILSKLEPIQVTLSMPRFKFDSSFSLGETLAAMGMPLPFSGNADFSGMTGTQGLFIKDVFHKAFVSVDEAGTEAAAATAVALPSGVPSRRVELTVDHPFVFLIRDIETGTILFLGRVLNPGG